MVIALTLAFNQRLAMLTKSAEQNNLEAADIRLGILRQIVEAIKGVKLFAWESSYLELITSARELECGFIQNHRMLQISGLNVGRAAPVLASATCILFYGLSGQELDAAVVFATISIFQVNTP